MAALIIVFTPLLVLHLQTKAPWRWLQYTLFTLVVILGFSIGFYDSMNYNRSKNFNTAHQILGCVVLAGLVLLLYLQWKGRAKNIHGDEGKIRTFGRLYVSIGVLAWVLAMDDGFL
jgi:cytochrome b561